MKIAAVPVRILFVLILGQTALWGQPPVISVDTLHNNHDKFLVCTMNYNRVPAPGEVRILLVDNFKKEKKLPIAEIIRDGNNRIKVFFYCYGVTNIFLKDRVYHFKIGLGAGSYLEASYLNNAKQDTIFDKQYVSPQPKPDQSPIQEVSANKFPAFLFVFAAVILAGLSFLFFRFRKKPEAKASGIALNNVQTVETPNTKSGFTNSDQAGDIVIFDNLQNDNLGTVPFIAKGTTIELSEYFTDTAVGAVTWSAEAVADIFAFVKKSLLAEPVPEVGGLLLGRVAKTGPGENEYKICVDAFLPDNESTFQDRFNLEFGANTFVDEFEYLENHPGSKRVGWLHTHPGHSIFLSQTDINSHKTAFPALYQIAVVIDTFDEFRTGIFSYTANGSSLNNVINKSKLLFFKWENLF